MAKTLTSNNIPAHSTLNDIAPDTAWLNGFSVESLDAFIKANAGDVSYGLDAGHMYDWLFKKMTPMNDYTTSNGEHKPARLVLTWQETRTGYEATSNVYLTDADVKEWLAKVEKRTNYRVNDGLPKRTNLNLMHALNWLSTHPISLAYDYVNDSARPYITFKWIKDHDAEEHGKARI